MHTYYHMIQLNLDPLLLISCCCQLLFGRLHISLVEGGGTDRVCMLTFLHARFTHLSTIIFRSCSYDKLSLQPLSFILSSSGMFFTLSRHLCTSQRKHRYISVTLASYSFAE